MPSHRPTDNMDLAVDLPQEEEFAMTNSMPYTYYNMWYLPKYWQEYADKYLLFKDITPEELKRFEEEFIKVIKNCPLEHRRHAVSLQEPAPHGPRKGAGEDVPKCKVYLLDAKSIHRI